MFVFSHTLVHPGILQGQVANFKTGSIHLHPVLEVSERQETDGETNSILFVHIPRCSLHKRVKQPVPSLALAFNCQVDLWGVVLQLCSSGKVMDQRSAANPLPLPTCEPTGCPLRSQRMEGLGLPAAMQLQSSSELISTSESLITCSHCG